jgi:hypothetical protein
MEPEKYSLTTRKFWGIISNSMISERRVKLEYSVGEVIFKNDKNMVTNATSKKAGKIRQNLSI